jgi:N-acyl-D-amino-acid deacylase
MKLSILSPFILILIVLATACQSYDYDVIITNGMIYDGTGGDPYQADIAVKDGRIQIIGTIGEESTAANTVDAGGLAVAPGFINMLSWAAEPLIRDGRSMSNIKQGVTLEIFGEGWSMGPLNQSMKREQQRNASHDIDWTTLGEFLEWLEKRGVSTNIASFVGGTTVRIHQIGHDNRLPTREEMENMRGLVRVAMEEGAMGLGTSLIYAPAFYASTRELIELAKVAGEYDGMYISHLRSEGNRFVESVEELLEIAREADIRAEIHHLKAAGQENWDKLDEVIELVDSARAEGLEITANMYTYNAAATSLAAIMPPWAQEGGHDDWIERLRNVVLRRNITREIKTPSGDWENFYLMAGGGENILLVGFRRDHLRNYVGYSLSEIAELREVDEVDAAIDLTIEDNSRIGAIYFLMSEENVRRQIELPWMSFGSDGGSFTAEGDVLNTRPHPRAYGNFARLLGKYVREEQIITLPEAVHRMTGLPATNLRLRDRGFLREGYHADIVIFNPDTIQDHATYENPHQYATGVKGVFVNGVQVLRDGDHTGEKPGIVVRGPGWNGWVRDNTQAP